MESNIKLYVAGGAAVLIIGILAYFAFASSGNNQTGDPIANNGNNQTKMQAFDPNKLPTTETVRIPVGQGSVVTQNFFLYPEIQNIAGEQALYLAKTDHYQLHYVFSGNYFRIELTLPKEAYRKEAESSLLYALNVNNTEMCKLKIVWQMNGPTGASFPTDLPLSFCPGALPLE